MNTQDFKRKLTAVFSADVAGYSRLMSEDEAATVKTLEAYKQVMFSLIRQHRGRVVDSPGDNILAEFASVVDAVQCGVAAQNEVKARNADLPENRRMQFRIGINLGDVIEEQDRIYGDGVNIAARLESCADPGGICVSKTAFDHIESKLPLGYHYLGEQTVKNIARPVGAYKVLMEPRITAEGEEKKIKTIPFWQRKGVLVGGIAVLLAIIGVGLWNFYLRVPREKPISIEKMAYPLPDKPSIAVLPFANMSANPEYDSLADSLSENIIYTLSYLPGMLVIARNSSFSYKGKPVEIRQVAEQLGVRYVLEGSVMRENERVRVTAQLIDAATGYHIWSARFDRIVKDIFSLIDGITKAIAIELQIKVSPDQWAALTHKTNNFDAWAASTKAYSLLQRGGREKIVEAQPLAEKAVALDPKYGFGWAILAAVNTQKVFTGLSESPADSIKLAAECNEKALTLDPTLSCATANRGQIRLLQGKVEDAITLCKKAVAMAPSLDTNYYIFGMTMDFAGRFEEAIALCKTGMRLNPIYPARYLRTYGMSCLMAGRKEEALTAFKDLLERAQRGEFPLLFPHLGLCAVYAELGYENEARNHVLEILKINPNFSLKEAKKEYRWKDPQNTERWLSALRKAGLPENPPLPLPDKPSIAVLPFVNMSDDKSQEYLADGITENIISALSQVPDLFVIARNSTFTYKGKPVKIQQAAEELGVRYVLEGSVQRSGDALRITAQLIDSVTGQHVWSERYNRELKNIFVLQDDIAMKVITALQVKLTVGEGARLLAKGTKNLEAYLKYLQASAVFNTQTKEGYAQARRLWEEVIALDPQYAAAYGSLGAFHAMEAIQGFSKSPGESLKQALELTKKAIAIDESDAVSHARLGWLYVFDGRQYDNAISECDRAIELAPNSAECHIWMSFVLTMAGRYEEAVRYAGQALRLNPYPPSWWIRQLGLSNFFAGRYEEAIAAYKKSLNVSPKDLLTHLHLTTAYSWAGRHEEALGQAAEILRINPKFSVEERAKFMPLKNQADLDRYLDGLRKAGLPDKPTVEKANQEKMALPLPDLPSIAVLPLVNMSGDPQQEFLSDGITENIITALSKVPRLFVIARNSTFVYKGKPVNVKQVSEELGVQYVLEGSIQKSADRIRINAQLIDALNGHHIWAERYDRDLTDLFALQDEITMKILTAIRVTLTEGELASSATKYYRGKQGLDCYLKVLEARGIRMRWNIEANNLARRMIEEAISMCPENPMGYIDLGWIYHYDYILGNTKSPRETIEKGIELAQKALSMDDSIAGAHVILCYFYIDKEDYDKAIAEGERAVSLNPGNWQALNTYANSLRVAGRAEEAIPFYQKAIRLTPFGASVLYRDFGQALRNTRRFEEAVSAFKKAIQRSPDDILAHISLAGTYGIMGREEEARAEATEVLRINPRFSLDRFSKQLRGMDQSQKNRLINALREAGLQ